LLSSEVCPRLPDAPDAVTVASQFVDQPPSSPTCSGKLQLQTSFTSLHETERGGRTLSDFMNVILWHSDDSGSDV